jgi:hypothetical protein
VRAPGRGLHEIMQRAPLLTPFTDRNEPESERDFSVVIAYENLAAGHRAMRLFADLVEEHRGHLTFRPRPWRFDLLADPEWRQFAAADARRADLLIISTGNDSDLPASVRSWVRLCLARKAGGGVVALFGTEGQMDTADSPRLQFLKQAAEEAGLDFFAPLAPEPRAEWSRTRATASGTVQSGAAALHPAAANRHWGINE